MAVLHDPESVSRAYYGTDARVHELAVGALLAVVAACFLALPDDTTLYYRGRPQHAYPDTYRPGFNGMLRQVADSSTSAAVIEIEDMLCPGGRCDAVQGHLVRPDGVHLTPDRSVQLAPECSRMGCSSLTTWLGDEQVRRKASAIASLSEPLMGADSEPPVAEPVRAHRGRSATGHRAVRR